MYICLQVRDWMVMMLLKAFMLEVPAAFSFLVQGLRTNAFGLGCPFYCTAPSLGTYLAFSSLVWCWVLSFVSGWCSGLTCSLELPPHSRLALVPRVPPAASRWSGLFCSSGLLA